MKLEEFRSSWVAFVVRWSHAELTLPGSGAQLITAVLADGLPVADVASIADIPSEEVLLACEIAVVRASGQLDEAGYLVAHSDVTKVHNAMVETVDPIEQFCEVGWRWLRNPQTGFDVDWYWHQYLDPFSEDVNPLLHYVLVGRFDGSTPLRPRRQTLPDAPRANASTRRACLYAAYDIDGVVDDYVLAYLADLSQYADVYYLADCHMDDHQLARLSQVTKGAWAVQHGRYDFGSYSILANELVGWDVLDTYDELLFANDSCYLLTPLEPVFTRMDAVPADWWGLQPSKRSFREKNGDSEPISLAEATQHHTEAEDWFMYDRLHVSSYLLVFRKRIMNDQGFRDRLAAVHSQPHKGLVIARYEIAISNYLLESGYGVATFIDALYPYHPLYTSDYFELLARGFPLLKRNFMSANPLGAPDLRDWKQRVLQHVPDAPVDMFERNLLRVAPDDQLHRSFSIVTRNDGTVDAGRPLGRDRFMAADAKAPKFDHWWAFPVCAYDHTFAGNERAVFEEIKDDPSIKKIILTRSRRVEVTGENVVIAPIDSREGQYHLLRAGQVFVKHGPVVNLTRPIDTTKHNVVNLWHGIPLKRFGLASAHLADRTRDSMIANHAGSRVVVTSSRMDTLAMSAAFFPASYPDMWPTGLPRNDFILRDEDKLPADLRATLDRLRDELAGRRLVMFLPTFRDGQGDSQYQFDDAELTWLSEWAERHGAVLGVREHMADKARTYSTALAPLGALDLSSRRYPDLEILYRVADALVSDYSSCLVDFMITGKPVMSFAYDYDRYNNDERGLFYELERVLPGPVCRTFGELAGALDTAFEPKTDEQTEEYDWKRRIFFDHLDDQASWRVVKRVKGLYLGND